MSDDEDQSRDREIQFQTSNVKWIGRLFKKPVDSSCFPGKLDLIGYFKFFYYLPG